MGVSRRDNRTYIIVMSVLCGLAAIPMAIIIVLTGIDRGGGDASPIAPVLAVPFACLPVVPLVAWFLWLGRYAPEPRVMLALALAWGASGACALAVGIEMLVGWLGEGGDHVMAGIVAPFTEELTKGVYLVALVVFCRYLADGVADCLVYAGMVGIGFAFTENILYFALGYNAGHQMDEGLGTATLGGTFLMRGIISPFAHPLFCAFTGLGLGLAIASRSRGVRLAAPAVGYLGATLCHMCWNGSLVFGGGGFLVMYLAIALPALGAMIAVAVWARKGERRMLTAALDDAADRGLIPYPDIGWMVDLNLRRRARIFARREAGPAGEAAMKDYQQAAVELGHLHSRYLRGDPPPDFAVRGKEYVARIGAIRPRIAFPGQVVTTR